MVDQPYFYQTCEKNILTLSLPTSPIGNLDTHYLEDMQRHS